jgi:hypothetical protein
LGLATRGGEEVEDFVASGFGSLDPVLPAAGSLRARSMPRASVIGVPPAVIAVGVCGGCSILFPDSFSSFSRVS